MAVDIISGAVGILAGASGGWVTARYGYKGKLDSLRHERFAERERNFDTAKTGYRQLHLKFAEHYLAMVSGNGDFDKVRDDHKEAQGVGFKPLGEALERFWPAKDRLYGRAPVEHNWRDVELAFETLVGLTLEQWERTQDPPGALARLRLMGRA